MTKLIAPITAHRREQGRSVPLVDARNTMIELETGEIVTLEGDNQSGKSTILGTLAGAYQASTKGRKNFTGVQIQHAMTLDGRLYEPDSVYAAATEGVVAVFQDDKLIPTMTVGEQLILRCRNYHFMSGFLGLASEKLFQKLKSANDSAKEYTPEHISKAMDRLFSNLPPARPKDNVIIDRIIKLLSQFDVPSSPSFTSVLKKFPDEISGGAKAIVRLVGALMQPKIKLLLLDEAFAGVSAAVTYKAIDVIRREVREGRLGVLVVSHVPFELNSWQPLRRYIIEDKKLSNGSVDNNTTALVISPLRIGKTIFIYEAFQPKSSKVDSAPNLRWVESLRLPIVAFVDSTILEFQCTSELIEALKRRYSGLKILKVEVSGAVKTLEYVKQLLNFLSSNIDNENGCIVCIGGGTLLNSAGFAASVFLRGRVSTYYVPTTITAVSDVAIGSKTAINYVLESNQVQKHMLGSYYDPTGIFLDRRYLNFDKRSDIVSEFAEVIKHGVVQSEAVFSEVVRLIGSRAPAEADIYEVAKRVAFLKQDVIINDIDERRIGRILQYGHLHAHSLERASRFTISHNIAVLIGIYIDLLLADSQATFGDELLTTIISRWVLMSAKGVRIPSTSLLKDAYLAETKIEAKLCNSTFKILQVTSVGCYSDLSNAKLKEISVSWELISSKWDAVVKLLAP